MTSFLLNSLVRFTSNCNQIFLCSFSLTPRRLLNTNIRGSRNRKNTSESDRLNYLKLSKKNRRSQETYTKTLVPKHMATDKNFTPIKKQLMKSFTYALKLLKNRTIQVRNDLNFEVAMIIFGLFKNSKLVPNDYFFGTLLDVLCGDDKIRLAFQIVKEMENEYKIQLDEIKCTQLLNGCSLRPQKYIEEVNMLYDKVIQENICFSEPLYAKFMDFYSKSSQIEKSQMLFNKLELDANNSVNYFHVSIMMHCYAKIGDLESVNTMISYANDYNIKLDDIAYSNVVTCYIVRNEYDKALDVLLCHNKENIVSITQELIIYANLIRENRTQTIKKKEYFNKLNNLFQKIAESSGLNDYKLGKIFVQGICNYYYENWVNCIRDIESVIKKGYFGYWNTSILHKNNKRGNVLDFHTFDRVLATFFLRYILSYKRDELVQKLTSLSDNKLYINILIGGGYHRRGDSGNINTGLYKIIKLELESWNPPIKIEYHQINKAIIVLNPKDIQTFIQLVPPRSNSFCTKQLIQD